MNDIDTLTAMVWALALELGPVGPSASWEQREAVPHLLRAVECLPGGSLDWYYGGDAVHRASSATLHLIAAYEASRCAGRGASHFPMIGAARRLAAFLGQP